MDTQSGTRLDRHLSIALIARLLFATVLACVAGGTVAQELETTTAGDSRFQELNALPEGLRVAHTPNPVGAQRGGPSGFAYTWLYKTTVGSLRGPITIEEFGCFTLQQGQWRLSTVTGRPFTSTDFAQWYGCPEAVVAPGRSCADTRNWTGYQRLGSDSEQ